MRARRANEQRLRLLAKKYNEPGRFTLDDAMKLSALTAEVDHWWPSVTEDDRAQLGVLGALIKEQRELHERMTQALGFDLNKMQDLEPEFIAAVDQHYWDLLEEDDEEQPGQ